MKKNTLIITAITTAVLLTACGAKDEKNETTNAEPKEVVETKEVEEKVVASLTNPFPEFTNTLPVAEVGAKVFVITDIFNPGNKDEKFENISCTPILAEALAANDKTTKVQPFSDELEIPNYFVVAIPKNQTAKKGDIVLAPWHRGESMKRAIVLDDKDPDQPMVNIIDVDWNNPAKSDKGVGYGQEQIQLSANSFSVISAPFSPGTTVAIKGETDWNAFTVLNANDENALVIDKMGKITQVKKSDCKALEIIPAVKAGDEVMAPWVGKFIKTTVIKVDQKFGRVYVKHPYNEKEPMIIPFGSITTSL